MGSSAGVAQLVEHQLPKLRVASSNLVSRFFPVARYPSGKGAVCKTVIRRFESAPRLNLNARLAQLVRVLA